jgi:hypothetical protein
VGPKGGPHVFVIALSLANEHARASIAVRACIGRDHSREPLVDQFGVELLLGYHPLDLANYVRFLRGGRFISFISLPFGYWFHLCLLSGI